MIMFRIITVSVLALASVVIASAGQIQVGAGVNGVNGLTTAYVGSGDCGGGCTDDYNYDEVLFSGLNNGSTTPKPYSTYSTTSANAGSITDPAADGGSGVKFAMINDGLNGAQTSNDYWTLSAANTQSITVPVGVYGVGDVWTMLNTEFAGAQGGANPDRSLTLTFNFGTTANASTVDPVMIKFRNTFNSATPAGQAQNAIDCSPVTGACGSVATPASGPVIRATTVVPTSPGGLPAQTVDADNLFSYAYNSSGNGSLVLNDQGVFFSGLNLTALGAGLTNLNTYLVSVTVLEVGSSPGESAALSAMTVDTAATPEPSTVFMLLTGLGAIGFAGFRRFKRGAFAPQGRCGFLFIRCSTPAPLLVRAQEMPWLPLLPDCAQPVPYIADETAAL